MGFTIDSPTRWRGLIWPGVAACLVVTGAASYFLGSGLSGLLSIPVVVGGIGAVLLARRLRRGGKTTFAVLVVTVLAIVTSVQLGKNRLRTAVREEIAQIEPLLRQVKKAPDVWEVPGVRVLDRAIVRRDPRGTGLIVRFPLRNRTAIEYVSNPGYWLQEEVANCSEEIKPGWYWRYECGG